MSVYRFAASLADLLDLPAGLASLAESAECRFDPDLHTGPDAFITESAQDREVRELVARQVCEECPVRLQCLDIALRTQPEHGIWAGFSPDEIAELSAVTFGEVA